MEKIFNFIKDVIVFGLILFIIYFLYTKLYNIDINFDLNYETNENQNIDTKSKEPRNYIDKKFYPYYAMLSPQEREVYYDILEGIKDYKEEVVFEGKVTTDELKNIYYSVLYDHPELFWVKSGYQYYNYEDSDEIYSINFDYIDSIENIEIMKQQFDEAINKIVSDASNYESDIQKEKFVHDTLVNIITYDENTREDQSAYGAMINGRAVCSGYAKAFGLIMTKLNIPTFYVVGTALEEAHAWNLILLDDDYYNVDVTWDDQIDRIIYDYYNLNDEEISKDHVRGDLSVNLVRSYGIKY